jgi:sortase A
VRRVVRETGISLITLGVVILAFVAYQLFGTSIAEQRSQSELSQQFSSSVVKAAAPTGRSSLRQPSPEPASGTVATAAESSPRSSPGPETLPSVPTGEAIDHLKIPAIGVDKFVVEGTAEGDLSEGPGHYKGTALPGQVGNVGIAGHRTTYGAPFFRLGELKTGDLIYLTDLSGHTWVYKVSEAPVVVSPDDVAVLDPTAFAQLTLTTCNPIFSATSRLVVFARLVGKATSISVDQTPSISALASGRPSGESTSTAGTAPPAAPSVPASPDLAGKITGFNGGGGTSKAWFPTLAYGAAVLLLWLTTRIMLAATRRWVRVGVFVAGVAVCAVPLWLCFENATRLLPPSV